MPPAGDFDICVLTPTGRGAVAVVALCGGEAARGMGRYYRSSSRVTPEHFAIGRIYYGHWESEEGEEVVACRTAPAEFEVHCHGGAAAVGRLVEDLRQAGARLVGDAMWRISHTTDAIQREAERALADARTERCAGIVLDQWHGALAKAVQEVIAYCQQGNAALAVARLRTLASRSGIGRHLNEPFTVALAGPPNVGKSSLINALVGYERTIVYDAPGTTRDVVTAETAIDGWPVALSDTAGLRAGTDSLEVAGVTGARARLAAVDLVVLVFDARQSASADKERRRAAFPTAIVVANKCDLLSDSVSRRQDSVILTSAITGAGIAELLTTMSRRLVPDPPPKHAAVPFTADQATAIEDAIEALAKGDFAQAASVLERIL